MQEVRRLDRHGPYRPLRGLHIPDGRRSDVPRHRAEGRLGHGQHGEARESSPRDEDSGPEATAILSNTFPDLVERRLGSETTKRARALFESMSTVDDALAAASVGVRKDGIWAMHDATEGGVRNAVWEMAQASGIGVDVDLTSVHLEPAVVEVSKVFGMDPLDAISEGTLLIAVDPDAVPDVIARPEKKEILAKDIGRFTKKGQACRDRGKDLQPADRDPFWVAFSRAFSGEIS